MIAPKWIEPAPAEERAVTALAVELGISEFFAALLCRRGFAEPENARHFLEPKLKSLSDPFLLPNMRPAVERIFAAIDRGERIVLYGDYDVDGITSLALLTRMLRAFGVEAPAFLPHRMEEGYGLSAEGIARCIEAFQPQLLIALDCGTSSVREVAALRERGIDVVVLDHHECKNELPNCVLLNPKLGSDFHYLCSVGVVFKLCHALLKTRPRPEFALRQSLDLVALGTVADIVPLIGENRILVRRGLLELAQTKSVGLQALMSVAGVKTPVSTSDIGFRLGPRLNAAGRLRTAEDALELLLTDHPERARTLATALDTENRERQKVEQAILQQAEERLLAAFVRERDAAIILGDDAWHPGVLGIVASRLSKAHHRPAFVIGFDENGWGKGSGRSIEGLSLVHALGKCGALLEKFGGHEMAAGLTISRENFAQFKEAFLACAQAMLTAECLQPCLRLDAEVDLDTLNFDFLDGHERLQPFGTGNAQPLLFARGVSQVAEPRALKEKHLRLMLRQRVRAHSAIYFNQLAADLPRPPWDIAFQIERHEYNERVSIEIAIKALRSSASC